MTRHIEASILCGAPVAMLTGVLLGLLVLRWPVLGGWLLALGVSALAWWGIYQVVTSAAQPKPTPKRDAAATVDGRQVEEVTVQP